MKGEEPLSGDINQGTSSGLSYFAGAIRTEDVMRF